MWSFVTLPLFVNDLHNLSSDMDLINTIFIKDMVQQVGTGLQIIHSNDFVHLDLKPENILYKYSDEFPSKYLFSICDFGSAFHFGVQRSVPEYGHTLQYASPEVICQEASLISSKSDVFSFGCVIFFMLVNGIIDMFNNPKQNIFLQLALIRQSNNNFDRILLNNHDYFSDLGFVNEGYDFRITTKPWYLQPAIIKNIDRQLIMLLKDMTRTQMSQRIDLKTLLQKIETLNQIRRIKGDS
jgi:serine/threonine protein kinase